MNSQEHSLIQRYFQSSERMTILPAGSTLIGQDGYNDRLYYVHSGELTGYVIDEANKKIKIFSAPQGAFIGVHSFFSGMWISSSTVVAETEVHLSWIDRNTPIINEAQYGSMPTQFMPVIIDELNRRQRRTLQEAVAKEQALERLYSAEQMTTLAQLAAGIAHELNNAIGVVNSKTDRLVALFSELLNEVHPEASQFFNFGLEHGQKISSSESRRQGAIFERDYKLSKTKARDLARAIPESMLSSHWLENPHLAIQYWKMGRDLHDLGVASRHSVNIVKSVKQLGRTEINLNEDLDINDTINRALTLLQSDLRRVSVRMRPGVLPILKGSQTEWVQVWLNIIKNACDAMLLTDEPNIDIHTRYDKQRILISVSNNGPEIDETTRRKIFQPSFTTKKSGLSFGLGLGLAIVKRIVSSYNGNIAVKSDSEQTIFRIKLPVEGEHET